MKRHAVYENVSTNSLQLSAIPSHPSALSSFRSSIMTDNVVELIDIKDSNFPLLPPEAPQFLTQPIETPSPIYPVPSPALATAPSARVLMATDTGPEKQGEIYLEHV